MGDRGELIIGQVCGRHVRSERRQRTVLDRNAMDHRDAVDRLREADRPPSSHTACAVGQHDVA